MKEELAEFKALLDAANKENEELRKKSMETDRTEIVHDKSETSDPSDANPQTEFQNIRESEFEQMRPSSAKEGESAASEVARLGDEEKQSIAIEEPNRTKLQSSSQPSVHSPPKRDAEEANVAEMEPDAKKIKESAIEDLDEQADVADV